MKTPSVPHSTPSACEPFKVRHVAEVKPRPPEHTWLIEELWLMFAVGILGGQPKSYKTYLAAELALAVASGCRALGKFKVASPGPVLLYCAEDTIEDLRVRFDGLALARKLELESLPIYFLDEPQIRIDKALDLARLERDIELLKPRLLVLDPFVRLARIDENSSTDVSSVLASLRALQRSHDMAILVVHHARKSPAAHHMYALRGSSDFAAWSDTNLYVALKKQHLVLSVQHRSAPSLSPVILSFELQPAPHLTMLDGEPPHGKPHDKALPQDHPLLKGVMEILHREMRPLSTTRIREMIGKRKADVVAALNTLNEQQLVQRGSHGWVLICKNEPPLPHRKPNGKAHSPKMDQPFLPTT